MAEQGTGGFKRIRTVNPAERRDQQEAEASAELDQMCRDVEKGKIRPGNPDATERPKKFKDWRRELELWLERQWEAGCGMARPTSYAVLQHLILRVNDSGAAWPGVKRLAAAAGCDERSVRRAVKELEDCGVLEPATRRSGERGPGVRRFAWPLPDLPAKGIPPVPQHNSGETT